MEGYEVDYWPSSNSKDVKWVLENYEKPSQFVNAHRKLTVPAEEKLILIAVKSDYKMHVIRNGKRDTTYEIALSQDPIGHKQRQGDNRLPEGEYKIIEKSRGPFSGDYSDYFGTGWMRINYPNAFDAEAGCRNGLISTEQKEKIIAAIKADREPPKTTKLGGGIGIHGWSGDWTADGTQNLTWGCISMHNEDMKTFQDLIPVPVKIIILP